MAKTAFEAVLEEFARQHDVAKLLNLIGGQETQDLASFPWHGGLAVRGAQAPLVGSSRCPSTIGPVEPTLSH